MGKHFINRVLLALALLASLNTVSADPGRGWNRVNPNQQSPRESGRDSRGPSGVPATGQSRQEDQNSESRRQQARMSPEERRALRRQINEVGQDIYVPRR